jgi:hypothetical protein
VTPAGLVSALIRDALTEDQIRDLAFEHYRPVYDEYAAAMSRPELIRRLVAWCDRQGALAALVHDVAKLNPNRAAGVPEQLAALELTADAAPVAPVRRPPLLAHPLPEAPTFVGRDSELEALRRFWDAPGGGVFCLVALGGAGKTAIAAEFLRQLQTEPDRAPDALLQWSFYEAPDAQGFLHAVRSYFSSGGFADPAGAAGSLYLTIQALENGGRNLLVLDGLERAQRIGGTDGLLGDIVDPMLSQLVRRLAAGLGRTKAVITTRLRLSRVDPWLGRTFFSQDVTSMTPDDALRLLRSKGVSGDDATLHRLVDAYGAHALTLDHLAGYLTTYHDGRAEGAYRLPEPRLETADVQEYRLARVLGAYADALDSRELALLSRLCIFRAGQSTKELHEIFSAAPAPGSAAAERIAGPLAGLTLEDYQRIVGRLAQLHLVLDAGNQRWTAHPAVRDYFQQRFVDAQAVEEAAQRHYARLVDRPGAGIVPSESALDALEEFVYHTLRLGRTQDAVDVYLNRIGGVERLGWELGQYGRCVRLLEEFPQCPDVSGLIWCYRALGDLDAAVRHVDPDDDWWLGMLGCLRGRPAEVVELLGRNFDDAILIICMVLTGQAPPETLDEAPDWPGLPVSVAEAWLAADRPDRAWKAATRTRTHGEFQQAWNDEAARVDLVLAEVARRDGELARCRAMLDKASQWIMKSGSQEHLCQLHLCEARLTIDQQNYREAETILRQGRLTAEHCRFGLLHIDLLIESARLALLEGRLQAALAASLSALNGITRDQQPQPEPGGDPADLTLLGARHPLCGYRSGADRGAAIHRAATARLGDQPRTDEGAGAGGAGR